MKLSSPLVVTPTVRVEVQHVLGVLGSAFLGAVLAFWLAVPQGTVIDALTHWSTARPLLIGALAVGLIAAATQAQKSYFKAAVSTFVAAVFALQTVACQQIQAAYPTLDALEKTVAADLAAGDSPQQIAGDVCKDLGGSALTDVLCSDATVIAVDVITYLVDTKVLAGNPTALRTALAVRPQLAAMKPAAATP